MSRNGTLYFREVQRFWMWAKHLSLSISIDGKCSTIPAASSRTALAAMILLSRSRRITWPGNVLWLEDDDCPGNVTDYLYHAVIGLLDAGIKINLNCVLRKGLDADNAVPGNSSNGPPISSCSDEQPHLSIFSESVGHPGFSGGR